jgi:hypothetical protein
VYRSRISHAWAPLKKEFLAGVEFVGKGREEKVWKDLPEIVETEMLATENIFFVSDKNFFDACNNYICEVITSIVISYLYKKLLLSIYPQRYQTATFFMACEYNCTRKNE